MSEPDRSSSVRSRRVVILDAAIDVVGERGLTALTHRATDEAAGLPQGSTTYYFPRKGVLIAAAAERLSERLEEDSDQLRLAFAELIADGRRDEALGLVATALTECVEEERRLLLARTEFSLAAARDPSLAVMGTRLTKAAQAPIGFYLRLLGAKHSQEAIETCLAVIDGMMLSYATGQGPAPTPERVAAVCAAILPDQDGTDQPLPTSEGRYAGNER